MEPMESGSIWKNKKWHSYEGGYFFVVGADVLKAGGQTYWRTLFCLWPGSGFAEGPLITYGDNFGDLAEYVGSIWDYFGKGE